MSPRRGPWAALAAVAALAAAGCAGPAGGDAAAPAAQASAPVDSPAELVGLSDGEVERRLGAPGFVRRDGGAQIWQYAGEDCLLDVFLYSEFGTLAVRHAELRRRDNRTLADNACLADALSRRI